MASLTLALLSASPALGWLPPSACVRGSHALVSTPPLSMLAGRAPPPPDKKRSLFGFQFGTEVDVGPPQAKKAVRRGNQGGGGGLAYRNTESARFSNADKGQMIRKAKLEAYINSEEEAASSLVPKIISGAALLSIFGGLIGILGYYGVDGLVSAPTRM